MLSDVLFGCKPIVVGSHRGVLRKGGRKEAAGAVGLHGAVGLPWRFGGLKEGHGKGEFMEVDRGKQ
jgi:hypothetical protein